MDPLDLLCQDLASGDDRRAEEAARKFPGFGEAGLHAARQFLFSADADLRWWGIRALSGFGSSCVITPELITALKDDTPEVRQAALLALANHPDPLALSDLERLIQEPDPLTARLSSNAFIALGTSATLTLLDILGNGVSLARVESARALSEIKDTRSVPGLLKAFESDSALVQYFAGLGLERMGVGMVYLRPE